MKNKTKLTGVQNRGICEVAHRPEVKKTISKRNASSENEASAYLASSYTLLAAERDAFEESRFRFFNLPDLNRIRIRNERIMFMAMAFCTRSAHMCRCIRQLAATMVDVKSLGFLFILFPFTHHRPAGHNSSSSRHARGVFRKHLENKTYNKIKNL